MNVFDAMSAYSSNLYIVRHEGRAYVIDSYREMDEEFDYGVWNSFDLGRLATNDIRLEQVVPEVYMNGAIDFLLRDDLKNHYGLPKEEISKLESAYFDEWSSVLENDGFQDVAKELEELYGCNVKYLDALSKKEIDSIPIATKGDLECIEAFNKQFASILEERD